ncbi:MarR family transcriptional regulator [Salinirubellus salinus]|uniref:MarR family transcriptional regulator n=1 Tax=Salinirubellus salinus TaxID=1364945 RepID=A0A9E7R5S0_9EURY|nr:helix-turn-helix domain-containing protein [Salinirubellus salinus]UWM55223.1 MarR family transcriptional regulator [Salinirubellus salinus]
MSDGRDTFIDYTNDPAETSIQSQRHELEDTPSDDDERTDLQPSSTLPLGQLDALDPEERRRAARKRGLSWPSTDVARDHLFDTIATVMRNEDDRVVDAPTALGKSGTIARTRWGARDDITGGKPVVHLSATRDARDEAAEAAREYGGEHIVLQSRHEACPVAAGDFDPPDEDEGCADLDHDPITINGQAASHWISAMCDGRGLAFSAVHRYLEEHMDQSGALPCEEEGVCPAIQQWEDLREGDHPLVIGTHQFAHVPSMRMGTNVVIDERPDYCEDLTTGEVRNIVASYLQEIDAPVTSWESFIGLSRHEDYRGDAAAERDRLQELLAEEPEREWYFEANHAHTLAPGLTRAIFNAEQRANGRRVGKTPIEPPRLDAGAVDDDSWNREWLTVVLDEQNDVRTVRVTPDFSLARSLLGLDAHPARPVWQANTLPYIQPKQVLAPDERRLWRRYERGLRVVQVGDATRPLASGRYFDERGTGALVEHLRAKYGAGLATAITTMSVEQRVGSLLEDVGVDDPETMHYGEEKSRNDFADESIGLVLGCLDPGDGYVLDLVAELDCDATVERSETPCDSCDGEGCSSCDGVGHKRARGRGFVGEDAETAQAVLASVRESHTAQAAGRYARRPEDPESSATVFVRTDAIPPGFADVQVPGVSWLATDKQRAVLEELRASSEKVSAQELADASGVSKRHATRTLKRLAEENLIDLYEGEGRYGATLYAADETIPDSTVDYDLKHDRDPHPAPDVVGGPYTYAVSILDPNIVHATVDDTPEAQSGSAGSVWDWRGAANPPPAEE